MDQELDLWGSFLPHKEDDIRELEPLLAHVLKFEYFHRLVSTIFWIGGWQGIRLVKGGITHENFLS